MKLTILLCSLFFAAIATKDVYVEGAAADSYQTKAKAPLNAEALGTLERGSRTDPTPSPKNCDALTDRKTCKKKDQKKVTSNPTLTSSPNPNLSDPNL